MKNKEEILITNNAEETRKLGEELAKNLKGGELIALFGDLGGGKTTFVQGLALGLGIKRRIISPTFIIIRTYNIESKITDQKPKTFYHLDLYRTGKVEDIRGLGIDEIIGNKNDIVVIEWAKKLEDLLPEKRIDIFFEYLEENRRKIKIVKYGIQN